MPQVTITLRAGRDEETKARLAREIAGVISSVIGSSFDAVHVTLDEIEPVRNPDDSKRRRITWATIHRSICTPGNEHAFFDVRRDVMDPAMAKHPGYVDSMLIRDQESEGSFLVVNRWLSQAEAEDFVKSELHRTAAVKIREVSTPGGSVGRGEVVHLDRATTRGRML